MNLDTDRARFADLQRQLRVELGLTVDGELLALTQTADKAAVPGTPAWMSIRARLRAFTVGSWRAVNVRRGLVDPSGAVEWLEAAEAALAHAKWLNLPSTVRVHHSAWNVQFVDARQAA